jgi:hypothetical protein
VRDALESGDGVVAVCQLRRVGTIPARRPGVGLS